MRVNKIFLLIDLVTTATIKKTMYVYYGRTKQSIFMRILIPKRVLENQDNFDQFEQNVIKIRVHYVIYGTPLIFHKTPQLSRIFAP